MTERAQALEERVRSLRRKIDGYEFLLGPLYRELDALAPSSAPVAPAGASEPPSEMDSGIVLLVSAASAASGYLERQQPDLAAWLWNAVQLVLNSQSAPVSPVEPTPEPPTESVDEKASKWLKATMLSKGRDEDTLPTAVDRAVRRVLGSCSGESLHRHLVRLVRELAPTGAPAPCVWRSYEVSAYPGCDPDNVSKNLDPDDVKLMRFCPYCGHPLTVER